MLDESVKTTLKKNADQLGFPVFTVPRVLKDKAARKKTETIILKTTKEINFIPNQVARRLPFQKTSAIGLIITDILNPFFINCTKC